MVGTDTGDGCGKPKLLQTKIQKPLPSCNKHCVIIGPLVDQSPLFTRHFFESRDEGHI